MDESKKFLEVILAEITEFPDQVKIDTRSDDMGVLLTVSLAQEDMGKVIGRAGQTAKAIRTLLRVVGMKYQARINLKINEPGTEFAGTLENKNKF